jgi:hypothetical protein
VGTGPVPDPTGSKNDREPVPTSLKKSGKTVEFDKPEVRFSACFLGSANQIGFGLGNPDHPPATGLASRSRAHVPVDHPPLMRADGVVYGSAPGPHAHRAFPRRETAAAGARRTVDDAQRTAAAPLPVAHLP